MVDRLAGATAHTVHQFRPDDMRLLDGGILDFDRVHGPRQTTDLYLPALAVHHGGRLVTCDQAMDRAAVRGAETRHLLRP